MGYEVFLVSRVHERVGAERQRSEGRATRTGADRARDHGGRDHHDQVFAGFLLGDNRIIKTIGLGLAAAILFDAFVIRLVLVPAIMYLLGATAWSMPMWLRPALASARSRGPRGPRGAVMSGRQTLRELTVDTFDDVDRVFEKQRASYSPAKGADARGANRPPRPDRRADAGTFANTGARQERAVALSTPGTRPDLLPLVIDRDHLRVHRPPQPTRSRLDPVGPAKAEPVTVPRPPRPATRAPVHESRRSGSPPGRSASRRPPPASPESQAPGARRRRGSARATRARTRAGAC
jgi:hypothetical protein